MFQPVSTSNFNWALFAFYTLLLVLMLTYPEAINPKTIQGCLKYWMEMEMEWNGMEWNTLWMEWNFIWRTLRP